MKRPRGSKTRRVTHALLETTPVVRRKRLSPVEVLHEALAENHALAKRARKAGDVDNHRIYSDRAVQIAQSLLPHAPEAPGEITNVFLKVFEHQRQPKAIEAPRDDASAPTIIDAAATEAPPQQAAPPSDHSASASEPPPEPNPALQRRATEVVHVDYDRQRPSVLEHPTVAAERFGFGPRGGWRGGARG